MDKKTFQVPNIGCNGCVNTIKSEISALEGVKMVEGNVADKSVTIEWTNPATWQTIENKLKEIDYAPAQ